MMTKDEHALIQAKAQDFNRWIRAELSDEACAKRQEWLKKVKSYEAGTQEELINDPSLMEQTA